MSHQPENISFRRHLHDHHVPIEPFQILASEVQHTFDCTTCARCCRYTIVSVSDEEVEEIARYLKAETADVRGHYTEPDPATSGSRILVNRHDACVFLDGNLCMIYEARPAVCRDFPHVAPHSNTLGGRWPSICRHAEFCPILERAIEAYKHQLGFK